MHIALGISAVDFFQPYFPSYIHGTFRRGVSLISLLCGIYQHNSYPELDADYVKDDSCPDHLCFS